MHILFTKEELEWINTKVFGWKILDGCPQKTKESILNKLEILAKQDASQNGRF